MSSGMHSIEHEKILNLINGPEITAPVMYGIKKHFAMLWNNQTQNIIGQIFENKPGEHAEVRLKKYIETKKMQNSGKYRKNKTDLYFIVIGLQYDYSIGMSMPCIGCVRTLCKLFNKYLNIYIKYSLRGGSLSCWTNLYSLVSISLPSSIICS